MKTKLCILDNGDFMVVRNNNENINIGDLKNEYNNLTSKVDFTLSI